jgi:hypothetical protein
MSSVSSDRLPTQRQDEEWRRSYAPPAESREYGGAPWGLIMTGLVIGGLAAMAWTYLGPDLRRYLKISRM